MTARPRAFATKQWGLLPAVNLRVLTPIPASKQSLKGRLLRMTSQRGV